MALSLSVLETYIDGEIEMMRRADKKEAEGNQEDSQAITGEWENGSAMDLMVLNVDCFTSV